MTSPNYPPVTLAGRFIDLKDFPNTGTLLVEIKGNTFPLPIGATGRGVTGITVAGATATVTYSDGTTSTFTVPTIGVVPGTRTIGAGTGLTGGGDLTADRTLAVAYGAAAGTAAQGNDARLSDARLGIFTDRGAWAGPGTNYAFGDVVTNGGQRWLNKAPHASTASFTGATNWIPLTLPVPVTVPGPRGRIGYSALAATSGLVSVLTTVPGLTTAITIPAGSTRTVDVTLSGFVGANSTDTSGAVILTSGSARPNSRIGTPIPAVGETTGFTRVMGFSLAPGNYTFGAQIVRSAGTGTVQLDAGTELIVTDTGPA